MGGDRYYIQKAPATWKVQRLATSLASGSSLRDAFTAAGVSQSTGYRMLKRRCR